MFDQLYLRSDYLLRCTFFAAQHFPKHDPAQVQQQVLRLVALFRAFIHAVLPNQTLVTGPEILWGFHRHSLFMDSFYLSSPVWWVHDMMMGENKIFVLSECFIYFYLFLFLAECYSYSYYFRFKDRTALWGCTVCALWSLFIFAISSAANDYTCFPPPNMIKSVRVRVFFFCLILSRFDCAWERLATNKKREVWCAVDGRQRFFFHYVHMGSL